MPQKRIYLDYAATCPLLPEAREAMLPWVGNEFGNPSSQYTEGRRARNAIDNAREVLSNSIGCLFAEVLFTSSGTEAVNMAIVGAALAAPPSKRRILVSAVEHHAVLHCEKVLARLGIKLETIAVDRVGRLDLGALEGSISDDVLLVSLMHANNELGTIQPVAEAAEIAHRAGVLFHVDAVQTYKNLAWKVDDLRADMISLSGHKIGGSTGAGALFLKAGTKIQPIISGGGQEREMRAGTENVAAIVGFATAAQAYDATKDHRRKARGAFLEVLSGSRFVQTTDHGINILPGHVHGRFPGIHAEPMLIRLDLEGVSASSGAACSSGSMEPSHVLTACGYSVQEAREGLRFTFGPNSSKDEAVAAATIVKQVAESIYGDKNRK